MCYACYIRNANKSSTNHALASFTKSSITFLTKLLPNLLSPSTHTYQSTAEDKCLAIALLALGLKTVHGVIVGRTLAATVVARVALAAVVVGHAVVQRLFAEPYVVRVESAVQSRPEGVGVGDLLDGPGEAEKFALRQLIG